DREVTADAHLAADHAAAPDARAARDADTSRKSAVGTDPHVVRDHDQIVELHSLLDHRILDRAAIDGGVGADLDVGTHDHGAGLRHFDPTAALLCKAETVAADHGSRLDHGTRADLHLAARSHARREPGVLAYCCLRLDHTECTDVGARIDARAGGDHRGGVYPRRRRG